MRRFLTLVCLLFLAIPAGLTVTGCYRNPAGNYCNGLGYGPKDTDVYTITLQPKITGISLYFGQTRQINAPSAASCRGSSVSVTGGYTYGTTNNQLVDISPTGNMCAGTWNRNSGGGIADYTICSPPSPIPHTNGLPYGTAFISASADSVTSNPVEVYVHAPVTSITLVGPAQCLSQTETAQLDAQACYSDNGHQALMCAPASVAPANYACPLAAGVTSVPSCPSSIGTMSYTAGSPTVGVINPETNQITANLPGTTVIDANLAGSGSSAGYFSTCPPASISVTLNGKTSGTVTQGVPQNLVTNVIDTKGNPITGLTLDYQSTNPLNIGASSSGQVSPNFPGSAALYAVCQPGTCNPAPINEIGVYGTGLSVTSNPVEVTVPGTATSSAWFGAPGGSQYFEDVSLLTGTVSSTVRLPYVPNSMVMDQTATNLYFGSSRELMVYSTSTNQKVSENPSVPGVVLAVSPLNNMVLINDQVRKLFYLWSPNGSTLATFGGMGTAAQWTPDGKTLYVTDSAAANVNGVTGHTNTLYVYNANTGWTTYPLTTSGGAKGPENLAIMVPGVGAYVSGDPTVAHTWCPAGNVGNYNSMIFYPQRDSVAGDSVPIDTDVLAATADGNHILGASYTGSGITLSDIAVTIPSDNCLPPGASESYPGLGDPLQPLLLSHSFNQTNLAVSATAVDGIVSSPAAVTKGTNAAQNILSFVLYSGNTAGAKLPYYTQPAGSSNPQGTVGYVDLAGSGVTAPIAGSFSPDNTLFFVFTSGDNALHYIDTTTLKDTNQISPRLPACTPGSDPDCVFNTNNPPASGAVPATVIAVKPRSTT